MIETINLTKRYGDLVALDNPGRNFLAQLPVSQRAVIGIECQKIYR